MAYFFLFQVFEENAIFHDISKFEEFLIIQFKNILTESLLIIKNRTKWSPNRSVIIQVFHKMFNHENSYKPNWTTQSPVANKSHLLQNSTKKKEKTCRRKKDNSVI